MKNISKVLSIILLLTFSVIINQCASNQKTDIKPVSFTEEVPKTINEIYFKDGEVIQCDIVWESVESEICCKKSEDIVAYSADDVDLVKTFGETAAKAIAKRYEKIKEREESARILRSIGAESKYTGGASSFSADGIEISNFGVTTRIFRSKGAIVKDSTSPTGVRFSRQAVDYTRSGRKQWVASCVVKNSTSTPTPVTVRIHGVDSNGYIVKKYGISCQNKIWPGEVKKCSGWFSYGSDDDRITKWEIIKIFHF